MLREINKLIVLLILFCFSSCSNSQEGEHVILSFNEEFVSYSTFTDNGIIVREKMNWTSTNNCISSSKTESLKLDKDILYIKQEIEKQEVWYPYLLLSSNKGVSYTELLPFVSFSVTNSLVNKTDSTYTVHQVRRIINGDIEREILITLNEDWLPIKEKELSVPFGEQKREYRLTDYSIKIPKDNCP